jgi:predicted ester cyclase
VRGTHTGDWELLGIAPTGRTAEWTETHVVRMRDGRIVEHWENRDELGLMQQLGA